MNSFHKLFLKINVLLNKVRNYFFIIEFQSISLVHDHGLLWIKNAHMFGIFSNKQRYGKFCLINEIIRAAQMHQHK
jgi:hypothetical protein